MQKERTTLKVAALANNTGQLGWLPSNPRQWTQTDIDRTAKSLTNDPDFLEDRPLLALRDGKGFIVFAGNLRLTAARKLKLKEVPGIIYTPESDEDRETIKRRSILDNGSFGAWDYDSLANEWDDLPLGDWGVPAWNTEQTQDDAEALEAKEDDFDEDADAVETRCKTGDIWQLGDHRLMCGDSLNKEKVDELMDGRLAQFILTDPPYGTTNIEWDERIDLSIFFDVVWKINEENAAVAVFGAQPFVTDLINAARKSFRYEIIWEKTTKSNFLSSHRCPLRTHENICVFYKKQPIFNPQKYEVEENRRVRHGSGIACKQFSTYKPQTYINDGTRFYGDVLRFSSWNGAAFGDNENATKHPTQKPIELIAYLVKMYSNENDLILDLFGGSGSTLIAAEQLGRKCFMMELDPHYCDIILARWEKLTGQTATKL